MLVTKTSIGAHASVTPRQFAGFTPTSPPSWGTGGFGVVFRDVLPNGLAVEVKVFNSRLDHDQKAEVGSIAGEHQDGVGSFLVAASVAPHNSGMAWRSGDPRRAAETAFLASCDNQSGRYFKFRPPLEHVDWPLARLSKAGCSTTGKAQRPASAPPVGSGTSS